MRDSGQRKLTYSSQNHCTSTLRSGRRKTIVSQTMCAPAERLSQSEIVLPLRKTCYYSPLAEVGVFSTEINSKIVDSAAKFTIFHIISYHYLLISSVSMINRTLPLCPSFNPENSDKRHPPLSVHESVSKRSADHLPDMHQPRYFPAPSDSESDCTSETHIPNDVCGNPSVVFPFFIQNFFHC